MRVLFLLLSYTLNAGESGALVIVGGGGTPEMVRKHFVELAGGKKARIAVLPQASSRPNRGEASVEVYSKLGAGEVYNVTLDDPKKAQAQINKATAIWFPGGSQAQLYKALDKAGLVDFVRGRHRAGIPFAGTSAGAAIMSEVMIPNAPEKPGLIGGNTPITKGLSLVPELIVDQHFIARHRMDRLLSAVMDHPDRIGVGIGEATAIVVRGGNFTVMGKGSVVVMDARKAKISDGKAGKLQSGVHLSLNILKAGQTFQFKELK
ncbi:MAG: cyanophycinase [Verrucomicrobiota bacterium]|nr:cyanophycinase [Verrucomicrobiota bacterium]